MCAVLTASPKLSVALFYVLGFAAVSSAFVLVYRMSKYHNHASGSVWLDPVEGFKLISSDGKLWVPALLGLVFILCSWSVSLLHNGAATACETGLR